MKRLTHFRSDYSGMALVVVLALIGLITLLALAMHSLSETELKTAYTHSNGNEARQMADVAVNLAISQLRKATTPPADAQMSETWVSQPGLVRRMALNGTTRAAYKLYSSRHLILRDDSQIDRKLLADAPPQNWDQQPNRYVDLNAPAVRSDISGRPLLVFPVLDPRAMTDKAATTIGGFSYRDTTLDGKPVAGVRISGGDNQRVPMPVEWIYLLKDGSIGTLDDKGVFIGSSKPSRENPMVGRVGFWADDESAKININTASEPTAWSVPTFFHEQDAAYARYQPLNGEFQRYPGHPATTALSPVLFPGGEVTVPQKEAIYQLIPKISPGGSVSGTREYYNPLAAAVPLGQARQERLFASVDELLLTENRQPFQLDGQSLSSATLQKAAFFLTAHSRAPESNPLGLPKVAIWPVSYRGPSFRTTYDETIAFCSTLRHADGHRPYMFQRGWADSLTRDVEHPQNKALLSYLLDILSRPVPGFSRAANDHFKSKYGDDLQQILVEIFDYIRSTNLCDDNLVSEDDKKNVGGGQSNLLGYAPGSSRKTDFKTFTDLRNYSTFGANDAVAKLNSENGLIEGVGYPGHGQTTPSRWTMSGKEAQGIGRFPTISEVGLHFICCADNTKDPNPVQDGLSPADLSDPNEIFAPGANGPSLGSPGGGGAPRILPVEVEFPDKSKIIYNRWYSNFPPRPSPNPNNPDDNKPDLIKYPQTDGFPYGKNPKHPGYQRFNWNHQLEANKPLASGYRRVQARFLLEFFVPSNGNTIIQPEISVRVIGLDKFVLNGQQLFPNNVEVLRSGRGECPWGNERFGGYGLGVTSLVGERFLPARFPMPADNWWGDNQWEVKPSNLSLGDELCVTNYDLVSKFIDVQVGKDGKTMMQLTGALGGSSKTPLTIELWSGHYGKRVTSLEVSPEIVQVFNVDFPGGLMKAPTLVRNTLPPIGLTLSTPDVEPVSYWTFYSKGALGFNTDVLEKNTPVSPDESLQRGRFHTNDGNKIKYSGVAYLADFVNWTVGGPFMPMKGCFFYGYDYPTSYTQTFRPRTNAGAIVTDLEESEEKEGCDVVQSTQIAHGDYRLTAAKKVVPVSDWKDHRFFGQRRLAHNFSRNSVSDIPGYDYGSTSEQGQLLVPRMKWYNPGKRPDFPNNPEASLSAQKYGDFDNGPGRSSDGPFINKPDEGLLTMASNARGGVLGYFVDGGGKYKTFGKGFFSPNRMIPSPVMFGSLPTGVKANVPWRTLLFRPQLGHFGGGKLFGGQQPPDHLLLDYFWMPVVEPYAISEPFSTAGKVNMNYQIFPFTHIRRATGMHGILTGVDLPAVPTAHVGEYKRFPQSLVDQDRFWSNSDGKIWHHKVDVEKTLEQFEGRFSQGRPFISPSEICSLYLVPKNVPGVSSYTKMEQFWEERRLTGDNVRERPYAGIYPRLTTRSNSFRVHYVAQTLRKARSTAPDKMEAEDRVAGEFRGSTLIERHLDPAQPGLPDFAVQNAVQTLDHFHEFRILETRRFGF